MPWEVNDNFAFDFDGTICEELRIPWKYEKWLIHHMYWIWAKIYRPSLKILFRPKGKYLIISGRPEKDRAVVEQWCKKHDLHPLEILMIPEIPTSLEQIAQWKLSMIKQYKIKTYVDNIKYTCDFLNKEYPECFTWHYTQNEANEL
jgi:hypothetical protein